ncbi:MAG: L-2-hydroxyglutarate oxidase [Candidatus Binatia bacterium]|nr:L-2-hydroxyglutarate oxidase [Candidatus Binatia bacterium]
MATNRFDITVIGGGIIGLATAMQLAEKYPRSKIAVLEKESRIATHQTGHNSGVIHSGIYYRPGSVKAETCVAGKKALLEFCDRNEIPYELCGKVIVAMGEGDLSRLEDLYNRGQANGVEGLELIGPERLREIEPHVTGIRALYAPTTGIIDFARVALAYASKLEGAGGEILLRHEVKALRRHDGELILETSSGEVRTKHLINCAGLFTDRLLRLISRNDNAGELGWHSCRIIPFRGEYFRLIDKKHRLIKGLIYPVPDPQLPFLGVHFTRTVHGTIEVGPNAVLALAREGYHRSDVNFKDLWDVLSYRGFWSMMREHWRTGFAEMVRSASKKALVTGLQRLIPDIQSVDLLPGNSGVRAQAVSFTGGLFDDFVIAQTPNVIHVLNAPSPGATASLAIGKKIVDYATKTYALEN